MIANIEKVHVYRPWYMAHSRQELAIYELSVLVIIVGMHEYHTKIYLTHINSFEKLHHKRVDSSCMKNTRTSQLILSICASHAFLWVTVDPSLHCNYMFRKQLRKFSWKWHFLSKILIFYSGHLKYEVSHQLRFKALISILWMFH